MPRGHRAHYTFMPETKRTHGRHGSSPAPKRVAIPPAHARLLETDLAAWAGSAVAHAGRNYALLGRVLELRLHADGTEVQARVRGSRSTPYEVRVAVAEGARLSHQCTCSEDGGGVCRHAVAALEALRFPLLSPVDDRGPARRRTAGRRARGQGRVIQQATPQPGFLVVGGESRTLTKPERLEVAEHAESAERRLRARREKASVRLLPSEGLPPRFVVGRRGGGGPYVVTLRGPKAERGACTCPDFFRNELGHCKHIERAKLWYLRKPKIVPRDVLSLWWSPKAWIARAPNTVREIRVDVPAGEVPERLMGWFDPEGSMKPVQDGLTPSEWIAQARQACAEVATACGWTFDLDPGVRAREFELSREETRRRMLAAVGEPVLAAVRDRLRFRLHAYQEDGVRFLATRGRAFLADDMGLGKTVQAVAAAVALRDVAEARRCLVVCPASLKHQWRSEIAKAIGEPSTVVEGRRALREEAYAAWTSGFLILNYELVLRDLDVLARCGADVVILDEAQRIKNWDTKTAKAVKQLASPHAFVLTGTPLENRLGELHSLVEFLHPRALGPRWRLLPYHAVADAQGRVMAYEDLHLLRRRLRPLFLRRERADVLDQLPEKTENTFWTEMSPAQLRPYRRLATRVAKLLASGNALGPAEVRSLLQCLTSMRILCNALAQFEWERHRPLLDRRSEDPVADLRALHSPKLEEFVDVLEDLLERSETKIVVFSQWERMLLLARYALEPLLERRGEHSDVFHGGLQGGARVRMLERFQEDPGFRVLLSTDAGGLGLNLQEAASVVVNLEVPWNPAVLEQRIARVHRLGQRRSVQVLHFVTRDAIEERVRRVLEGKRALFDGLLVDDLDEIVFDEAGSAGFVDQLRSLIAADDGLDPD